MRIARYALLALATVVLLGGILAPLEGRGHTKGLKCVMGTVRDEYVATCERDEYTGRDCWGYCEVVTYPGGDCKTVNYLSTCNPFEQIVHGRRYAGDCYPAMIGTCRCATDESRFIGYEIGYRGRSCY